MNTLSTVLKNQVSPAMDVDKLFTKLHEDQSLHKMNDLLEHIFNESSQSILEDYSEQSYRSLDDKSIKNYHDTSLMLFKNKLMMIVQMTIENIHNSTLQKDLSKQPNQNQSESMIDEKVSGDFLNTTKLIVPENELSSAKSTRETEPMEKLNSPKLSEPESIEKLKVSQKSISPVKKAKSPSSGKAIREVSYVLRPNKVTSKKRLDSTNNTTIKYSDTSSRYEPGCSPISKSPSLLNAILSPIVQHNSRNQHPFDRNMSRNSSPNQTSILNPSILSNRQNYSVQSHRQALNTSQSFVQSEFNYIRGPATFTGAQRTSWVDVVAKTDSPGPALYNPKLRSRSPSPTIGKAPKVSWVDEVARTESPGPAKYNPIMRSRSPSPTIPKAEKICWVDVVAKTDSPGPARYHPILKSRSPSPTIGKALRTSWVDIVAKTDSPGPAAHYGSMHFLSK